MKKSHLDRVLNPLNEGSRNPQHTPTGALAFASAPGTQINEYAMFKHIIKQQHCLPFAPGREATQNRRSAAGASSHTLLEFALFLPESLASGDLSSDSPGVVWALSGISFCSEP